jgi:hypothetical protein
MGPYAGVITSPYVPSRVNSNTFTMGNSMQESTLTLCQNRLYPPVRDCDLASECPFCISHCRGNVSSILGRTKQMYLKLK